MLLTEFPKNGTKMKTSSYIIITLSVLIAIFLITGQAYALPVTLMP